MVRFRLFIFEKNIVERVNYDILPDVRLKTLATFQTNT